MHKQGSGDWIIDSGRSISGPVSTSVNSGTLTVNGLLNSLAVTVQVGATLNGTGTITGNLTNFGFFSPGDVPGTLTVNGNYTQSPSGTFVEQIASPTNYSRLLVNGHASLAGALQLSFLNGFRPSAGQQFTIISATGGVSGTFSRVISSAGIPVQVLYGKNGTIQIQSGNTETVFHFSDGTPNSTTAFIADTTFQGFGSLSDRLAESAKKNSIGITFDAGEFTYQGHHGDVYGFPITGQFKFTDRLSLNCAIPLEDITVSNAHLFQSGLSANLPIVVVKPSATQPWTWIVGLGAFCLGFYGEYRRIRSC